MRMAMAFLMKRDFHLGFPPLAGTLTAAVVVDSGYDLEIGSVVEQHTPQ
jgi:hypothetical protein